MTLYNKDSLIPALPEKANGFLAFIEPLDAASFEKMPGGKWSAGQHLDHLIRSIRPLQLAYAMPGFVLKIFFGTANRASRSYEELVEKYKQKLAAGGTASGPFVPPVIPYREKAGLIKRYRQHIIALGNKVKKKSESDLDKYILPHPLLGKITLREMIFFTIYHNQHHLDILQRNLL